MRTARFVGSPWRRWWRPPGRPGSGSGFTESLTRNCLPFWRGCPGWRTEERPSGPGGQGFPIFLKAEQEDRWTTAAGRPQDSLLPLLWNFFMGRLRYGSIHAEMIKIGRIIYEGIGGMVGNVIDRTAWQRRVGQMPGLLRILSTSAVGVPPEIPDSSYTVFHTPEAKPAQLKAVAEYML